MVKPSGPMWDQAINERNWGIFKGFWDEAKSKYAKRPIAISGGGAKDVKAVFRHTLAEVREALPKLPKPCWIGYLPREGSALIGLDFDHVIDPETGEITADWAHDAITAGETYTELSPSGDGIRMLVQRKLSDSGFSGEINDAGFFAHDGKGFTLTGNSVFGSSEIGVAPKARTAILERKSAAGAAGTQAGKEERKKRPEDQVAPEGEEYRAFDALALIPPRSEYADWLNVLYAFTASVGFGGDAWEAFDAWSSKGDGYNAQQNLALWRRAQKNPSHSFGFTSLMNWAEEEMVKEALQAQRRWLEMKNEDVIELFRGAGKADVNKRMWDNLSAEDWRVVVVMFANRLPADMHSDAIEYFGRKWQAKEDQANG